MKALQSILSLAMRALDAAGGLGRIAEILRDRGLAVAAAAAVVGLVALTVAGRFPRGLAFAGGAVLGALAAVGLRAPLATHVGASLAVAAPLLAVVTAAACALTPRAFPVAIGAVPGLLLGLQVPLAGRAEIGGAVGALVLGAVALLFARPVAIGFACALGGLLAATAAVALGGARPLARDLVAHPLAILAFALVLAIAGAAYQLARGEDPARASGVPPPQRS
jgi:hypothetical protein